MNREIPTDDQVTAWAVREHKCYHTPEVEDVVDLVNGPTAPDFFKHDTETSYRRGYMHGMAQAVEMIRSLHRKGFVRSTEISNIIEDWNHNILGPWRGRVAFDIQNGSKRGPDPMEGHPTFTHESWPSIRERILRRDNGKCVAWGDVIKVQVDHIFPVQDGGIPTDDNLQSLCIGCHVKKGKDCD